MGDPIEEFTSPLLSLILCSRNDEYMGNSRWRLETTLNYCANRLIGLGRSHDVEVLVADWGSETPLRDVLDLSPAASRIVSFIHIPGEVAVAAQQDSPFAEVIALNAAARRARGRFIGRIDQDTLVGDRFFQLFFKLSDGEADVGTRLDSAVWFANQRMIPYRFAVRTPTFSEVERFVDRFGSFAAVECSSNRPFHDHGVGIFLMHREIWHSCGGYDESMIYMNSMEIDMISRLKRKYPVIDLGKLVNFDFYHLEHYHPRVPRKSSTYRRSQRPPRNPAFFANGPDWGLESADLAIEEARPVSMLQGSPGPESAFDWLKRAAAESVVSFQIDTDRTLSTVRRFSRLLLRAATGLHRRATPDWAKGAPSRLIGLKQQFRQYMRYLALARRYASAFGDATTSSASDDRVLFIQPRGINLEISLALIKALRCRGFSVAALDFVIRYRSCLRIAGANRVLRLHRTHMPNPRLSAEASRLIAECRSMGDLLSVTYRGIRVGRIAASTAIKQNRIGNVNMGPPPPLFLTEHLAQSLAAADWALSVLEAERPTKAIFLATEYTPNGELFDACVATGVDTIVREETPSNSSLFFKRYSKANTHEHVASLSEATWSVARSMPWTDAKRDQLEKVLCSGYYRGDWYGVIRSQFDTRLVEPAEVRRRLGLHPQRKAAFIFAHILFDAPFNWVSPLYASYEEWLIETVKQACANEHVDWIIKIHPANAVKLGNNSMEPAEVRVLSSEFGKLPPHVKLMPARTDISTLSLFGVMDYCLTVRGTIGIEASARGIPVLTAGASRYSNKGFTVDSASVAEYRRRLSCIQDILRLTPAQQELAQRYAYALFLMRPLHFESVSWDYGEPDGKGGLLRERSARINVTSPEGWQNARDLNAFVSWVADSGKEDYLMGDEAVSACAVA